MAVPNRAFLLLGGLMGVVFTVVMPPFMVADEDDPFLRAIQVSALRFRPEWISPDPGFEPYSGIGGMGAGWRFGTGGGGIG